MGIRVCDLLEKPIGELLRGDLRVVGAFCFWSLFVVVVVYDVGVSWFPNWVPEWRRTVLDGTVHIVVINSEKPSLTCNYVSMTVQSASLEKRGLGLTIDDIRRWPPLVGLGDAARALGVSRSHVKALMARGEFPIKTVPLGKRTRVHTASILQYLEGGGE
jgi:predicted DNA-binding transcriptional regulator AlpA